MVPAGLIGGEGTADADGGGGVDNTPTDSDEEAYEIQQKKDEALLRWTTLCLLKASDPKTDLAASQERLTEKVDDWMLKMVMKIHLEDDKCQHSSESQESASATGTSANIVPTDDMKELTKNEESKELKELKQRMKAREKAEWERERQLILDGKMKLKKAHLLNQDSALKLHHEKIQIKRKHSKRSRLSRTPVHIKSTITSCGVSAASSGTASGSTTSSCMSSPKSVIKLSGPSGMNKVKANAFLDRKQTVAGADRLILENEELEEDERDKETIPCLKDQREGGISGGPPNPVCHHLRGFNWLSRYHNACDEVGAFLDNQNHHQTMNDVETSTETVVAQLFHNEGNDKLKNDLDKVTVEDSADEGQNINEMNGDDGHKEGLKANDPVFAALDDAKDLDDMFRIAEILVNPNSYGIK